MIDVAAAGVGFLVLITASTTGIPGMNIEREAAIGPDLSHRRTLIGTVLREPRVRAAMLAEVDAKKVNLDRVEKRANGIAREIAADYSYVVVRLGERLLGRLWNRIYDGLTVRGAERLQALARDNTLAHA